MGGDLRTCFAVPDEDLHCSEGEAGFGEDIGDEVLDGHGGFFGGFYDDRVPCSECGGKFLYRDQERMIPWSNQGHYSQRS